MWQVKRELIQAHIFHNQVLLRFMITSASGETLQAIDHQEGLALGDFANMGAA